ncbi:MAG: hypothetical protein RML33_11175 [Acidobacteriota bacterium]|nr:hypothetical protein [Leptospiraceae bacterium]MDW8305382.1 hypothetical protein [Acidobacteriota bacterium]
MQKESQSQYKLFEEVKDNLEARGWWLSRSKGRHHLFRNLEGEAIVIQRKENIPDRILQEILLRIDSKIKNASEWSPETPIEVRRHYRRGPEGYLTPRQRAILAGQQMLFEGADETDRDFLRSKGLLKNPELKNLQKLYDEGASKADLRKALRATGLSVEETEAMLSKLKPRKRENFSVRAALAKALAKSKLKSLERARDKAKEKYERAQKAYEEVAKMVNPDVKKVYEIFQGRESSGYIEVTGPVGTPDEVAKLGDLAWIEVVNEKGIIKINFDTPNNEMPLLVADKDGNLHVVGGTYRMKELSGQVLGEVHKIAYITAKSHVGNGETYEYIHEFGEEGGRKPFLYITEEGLFKIIGGDYRISSAGIEN